jgi:hypothetical protein
MNKNVFFAVLFVLVLSSCTLFKKDDGPILPSEIRQWAVNAEASSSAGGKYGANRDDQSPTAATGEPDVIECMDDMKAWAPEDADDGLQWIEFKYYDEVHVSQVRVKESLNPGTIIKLELKDGDNYFTLWEGTDDRRHKDCPGFFEKKFFAMEGNISLNMTPFKTDTVRVTLDTELPEWNEIDAVELVGYANKWYYFNNTVQIE